MSAPAWAALDEWGRPSRRARWARPGISLRCPRCASALRPTAWPVDTPLHLLIDFGGRAADDVDVAVAAMNLGSDTSDRRRVWLDVGKADEP
jgi:hypothetical protein